MLKEIEMLPPPFPLQPQGSDPGLDRVRAGLRIVAAVLLTLASIAALPLVTF